MATDDDDDDDDEGDPTTKTLVSGEEIHIEKFHFAPDPHGLLSDRFPPNILPGPHLQSTPGKLEYVGPL